jgi:hypothetical protein
VCGSETLQSLSVRVRELLTTEHSLRVKFGVLTVLTVEIIDLYDVALCVLVDK